MLGDHQQPLAGALSISGVLTACKVTGKVPGLGFWQIDCRPRMPVLKSIGAAVIHLDWFCSVFYMQDLEEQPFRKRR